MLCASLGYDRCPAQYLTVLNLYLQGSGIPRRVIEALHGLGLCHSYRAGLDRMKQLEQHTKVCIALYFETSRRLSQALANSEKL